MRDVTCPVCRGSISIDPHLLAKGASFACSNTKCDATIVIDASSRERFASTLEQYERLAHSEPARGRKP